MVAYCPSPKKKAHLRIFVCQRTLFIPIFGIGHTYRRFIGSTRTRNRKSSCALQLLELSHAWWINMNSGVVRSRQCISTPRRHCSSWRLRPIAKSIGTYLYNIRTSSDRYSCERCHGDTYGNETRAVIPTYFLYLS